MPVRSPTRLATETLWYIEKSAGCPLIAPRKNPATCWFS
jgi:hypothetical protein